jgi:hypothetical protein
MKTARTSADSPLPLYVACLAVGTLAAIFLYPTTLEDAYITFRYAHAFALGQGIGAWNPGGPPVEGFSSTLWMFLIGFAEKLGLSQFLVSKAFGYLGYALTSLLFFIASSRRMADGPLPEDTSRALYLSALISALFAPLVYYSMTGMEATFFCFEVAAVLLAPFLLRSGTGRALWSSLFAAAIVFTRPEGVAVALAANAYWLFVFRGKSRWPAAGLASALATLAAMTAYRLHRFGEFVPNTYFAKASGGSLAHRLALGARYDVHFFVVIAPLTLVFFLGVAKLVADGIARRTPRSLTLFVLGLFVFFTLSTLKIGGDAVDAFPMYRQFDHIAPIWILFASLTLASVLHSSRRAILCALAVVLLADAEVVVRNSYLLIQHPRQLHAQVGLFHVEPPNPYFLWLRRFSTPDTVSAVTLAGQWPFYVPGRYIDNLGLNDPWIAKHGSVQNTSSIIDSKSDMNYVLSQHPDIIDGTSSGLLLLSGECALDGELPRQEMLDELKADPRFQQDYVFIRNAPYNELNRALYFRKDFAARFPGQLDTVPVTETSLYRTGCPVS